MALSLFLPMYICVVAVNEAGRVLRTDEVVDGWWGRGGATRVVDRQTSQ